MENLKIIEKLPNIAQYIKLRKIVGWGTVDIETAKRGINNSSYCICIECEGSLVGFGRVIGDFDNFYSKFGLSYNENNRFYRLKI